MKVLLAGGGTGGHINPAIAIGQYFKSQGHEVLFAGTPKGMEATMVVDAGFNFTPIEVMGFWRGFKLDDISHNIKALTKAATSLSKAKTIIKKFKPDVVIGTGGYVSGPIVYMATRLKIPTAIHEQNAFPGITTKFLANKVSVVFSAVKEVRPRLKATKKFMVVGNPIRESITKKSKQQSRNELKIDDRMFVFSFGGSIGADTLNRIGADLMEWNQQFDLINHVHGYGRLGRVKFPKMLSERNISMQNVKAYEYINNIDTYLAAADLVICRAGAITISELEATSKASILVPSPNVTENHQFHNAMAVKKHGGCIIIEEKDYDKQKLINIIEDLYNNSYKLNEISKKAGELAINDTTKTIYNTIITLIN